MDLLNNVAQHLLIGAEDLPWLEQGLLSIKESPGWGIFLVK